MDLEEITFRDDDGALTGHIQIYGTMHRILMIQIAWEADEGGARIHRTSEDRWYGDFTIQKAAVDEWQSELSKRMPDRGDFDTIFHEDREYVLFIEPETT